MSLVSFSFLVFVGITLLIYYIIPLRYRWIVLLAASIFFYSLGNNIDRLAGMLCMALFAYFAGLVIGKNRGKIGAEQNNDTDKKITKNISLMTGFAVAIEIAILIILKDNIFFIDNTNTISRLLGFPLNIEIPTWVAPLGISYYTLILVGYILDVSWGTSRAERNPAKFVLFSCYFPQMTSGPFTKYQEMKEQLFVGHHFNYLHFCFGMQRVLWGLFKKLIIAERLSTVVSTLYGDFTTYAGIYVLIAVVGYTLQVYADFSGCMDIIIGVSEMFGVILPENFRTPFFSTSLSEVWRRWHMTLGFWVKEYILYPVLKSEFLQRIGQASRKKFGKKAGKKIPTYIGMFITWSFVGFWHGGSWKFIFGSGLFFFVMIVGGMLLEPVFVWLIRFLKINTECFSWRLFQRIRTFLLFAGSVSFGRAANLPEGFKMWRAAFSIWNPWILFDRSLYWLGLDRQDFWILIFGLMIFLFVSIMQQNGNVRILLSKQNLVFRWVVLLGLMFSILILGQYGPGYNAAAFIYGGF